MAINIDHNFVRQFGDVFETVAQQQASKLRMCVNESKVVGKDMTIERLQNANNVLPVVSSRHADTLISDLTHSRRVAFMNAYARAYMVDSEDKLKMMVDPTNEYLNQIVGEYNRTLDLAIIQAALGAANAGENGTTSVAFTTGQTIAHGSAGLTEAKVKQALQIMLTNDVDIDREELFLVTNGKGLEDLLNETGLKSSDFVTFRPNMDGKVPVVAGFKVVLCQRLNDHTLADANAVATSSSNRPTIALAKSAVRLGIAQDRQVHVDQNINKNYNFQIGLKTAFGAVRAHDEKVVDIRFQE